MTQISLKLFTKLPFARNDTGNLRGRGVPRDEAARPDCTFVEQGVRMWVFQMIFRKAGPIAVGPRSPASLQRFPADHQRVVGVRCQS